MTVEEKVKRIMRKILGIEVSIYDTFDDLYINSSDLAEIIDECEYEFCYTITDDQIQSLETVQDLVNLITNLNKIYD